MEEARPLDVLPGIFKESSEYASQGRYSDGSNVRFFKGFPERIGGNSEIAAARAQRPPRALTAWRSLSDSLYTAVGHARGVELVDGGTFVDVSPVGTDGYPILTLTVSSVSGGPFTAGEIITDGTSGITAKVTTAVSAGGPMYITVDETASPAVLPEYVITLTGAPSGTFLSGEGLTFSGGGTASWLATSGSNIYVYAVSGTITGIVTGDVSGASGTVSSSQESWTGTITGGTSSATASVDSWEAFGKIDSGATTVFGGSTFGSSTFGGDEGLYSTVSDATTWTFALWGEDLIANPRDGEIYVLDTSAYESDATTNMTKISNAPSALGVFMNDDNRTLLAYGADGDPLNIAWCDEEDYTVWTATSANTAGSIRCEDGSIIVGKMEARGGHLISTDTAVYLLRYIGLPFVFSLDKIADQAVMIGPNASAEQDGVTYWMGVDGFYFYDGAVNRFPCDVHQYVFGRLNAVQSHKVFCSTVRAYNEVWWYYVSDEAADSEVDSYVCYNTVEQTWHIGSKARTAMIDSSVVLAYPTGCEADGTVNAEELGLTDNGADISYSLQTSEIEIGDGNLHIHTGKLIPDYERVTGTHTVSIKTRGYPQRTQRTKGPYDVTSTTEKISVRARGAMMSFLFEGSDDFRMGRWRYAVRGHALKGN